MTKAERSRNLRYKRGALASMGWQTIMEELEQISEQCSDVAYYIGDNDTLIDALDGDEEEAFEFRMGFSDLNAKCDAVIEQMYEWDCQQDFDDCTVALIGNRYELVGYDSVEEDYFQLCGYEEELATTEAGKRLCRHTKAEMVSMIGQALGTLLAFYDLRQQYDYLKATMEILTDDNRSVLRQIKEIEQLYERVTDILPAQKDVEMFDRMVEMLPERMWVE